MTERKITFGRIFWPSFWAAIFVSVLGALLWLLVFGLILKGLEPEGFRVSDKTVLHMTLKGTITERGSDEFNPMAFSLDKKISLPAILHGFEQAAKDDKIKGIFMEIDALDCGLAAAKEIRDAMKRFQKSGKFILAYNSGELVSTSEYYLSSAAGECYGFPTSNMQFIGLGAELSFFKNTMDKLGVEMQIIRGSDNDFKSAVEPLFRENMSDSARLQTETYIHGIWNELLREIGSDRKISAEKLNNLADQATILTMKDAADNGLIDGLKYRDEILNILSKKVKLGKGKELELLSFEKFAKKRFYQDQTLQEADKPEIAVILAEGGVATSGDGLTSEDICEQFREVRKNKSVKVVVFRINSPGGSALASDEIWREVKLTNEKIPVIVSMGNVAASGGYYIAAPATRIFAEANTITGSIGVFGVIPYTGKMMEEKLGITFDRVATNKHSVITTNRKLTEEEFLIVQKNVDQIYDDFKSRVAEGRKMTKEQVNVIGRGRVWTGTDALRIGLVDELGGLYDAIAYSAKEFKADEKKILYYPHVKEDKLMELLEQFEEENTSVKIQDKGLPKELVKHYQQLRSLEAISGIQMRMPFELELR